jgi:hypothetical protein
VFEVHCDGGQQLRPQAIQLYSGHAVHNSKSPVLADKDEQLNQGD